MKLDYRSIAEMLEPTAFFLGRRWLRSKGRMRFFKKPEVGKIVDRIEYETAPKWQYDEMKPCGACFTDIGEVQWIELGVKAV